MDWDTAKKRVDASLAAREREAAARAPATLDIVETAAAAETLKTPTTTLEAAGLTESLKGEDPFTVLAPTDAAFAKLPAGTVENLLKPENKAQLIDLLNNHVVAGGLPLSMALEKGEGGFSQATQWATREASQTRQA